MAGGGGGKGGGGGATQTQTSSYQMSPQQQELFNSAFPVLQEFAQTPSNYRPYAGPTYAPSTDTQKTAWQGYLNAMPAVQRQADQAASTENFLQTKAPYVDSNPYLQQAIQAAITPANQNFQNVVMPSLRTQGIAAGQPGSSREGIAEALAANLHSQNISNITSGMSNQGYQTGLNAMLQGLNMAPSISNMQLTAPAMQEGVGMAQQQANQAQMTDAANRYYTQQQYPLQVAQQLMQSLYQVPGGKTVNVGSTSVPKQNPIGAILGAMLPTIAIGASFLTGAR